MGDRLGILGAVDIFLCFSFPSGERIDIFVILQCRERVCGLMDKAPDFGSGDCRFESCHARPSFTSFRLRGFTQFSSQINLLQCPWPHLEVLLHKYLVTLCCTTWENMLSMIGIILGDIGLHTYLAWRLTMIKKVVPLRRGFSIALRLSWPLQLPQMWVTWTRHFC